MPRIGKLGAGVGHLGFLGGAGNKIPSWVLSGASVDLDFATAQYYGGALSSLLTISRASSATDLLPSSASGYAYNTYGNNVLAISPSVGLLIFEARTNLFLNSTAPVTQTITLSATGSYTIWVNGAGSAAIAAGTATITGAGTATNGTPVVINCTATGTVVITITGSLNAVQLEKGAFGTSLIVTGGSSATRAADSMLAAGALLSSLNTDPIWVRSQTSNIANWNVASGAVILSSSPSFGRTLITTTSGAVNQGTSYDGFTLNCTAGSGDFTGVAKLVLTGDGSGRAFVFNNGSVASDLGAIGTPSTGMRIGSLDGANRFIDGAIQRLTVGQTKLSNSAAKALTV